MYFINKSHLFVSRIILLFFIFITIIIAITSYVQYVVAMNAAKANLQEVTNRVNEDIHFKNGKWDTTKYNADSNIPDINPLYVITSDGFVIERWKPISGLLDVVEFTRLLAYDKPATIQTVTNENWRILSKPIKSNQKIVGVIAVTAYRPEFNNLEDLDRQLQSTLETITTQLNVKEDTIDITHVDERQIPYNITFQIVNRFNRLLYHNNNTSTISRSPSFIDNSYVDAQLSQETERIIEDSKTQKKYLILTVPIRDEDSSVVGLVVAGYPVDSVYSYIYVSIFVFFSMSLILGIIMFPLLRLSINKFQKDIVHEQTNLKILQRIDKISFNKKQCTIIIDDQTVDVPYASFQYYFCILLFSKPDKRWETDELLDKFGELTEARSWRKVYDSMTALNKKTETLLPDKLFVMNNKTFRINPIYSTKVS